MTVHKAYGVSITPSGGSATLIGGVESQDFQSNTTHLTQVTSGQTSPQFVSVSAVKPRITFNSYQIAALYDVIGSKGVCLDGGAGAGMILYELDTDDCGAFTAGSTHRTITLPNGRVVPRQLTCQHEGDAQLSAEAIAIFDGTNLPIIPAGSVAAPTGLEDTERFTLGEVTLESVTLTYVQSVTIDFNNEIETAGGDGDPYPKNVDIRNFAPTIRITCLDVGQFKTSGGVPLPGLPVTHANTSIVFRRRVIATEAFSDDADSVEITAAGVASVESVTSQPNQPKQITFLVTCYHDTTNEPITMATDYDLTPAP